MSQLFKNTTVPPRSGRVAGPARAGLKAAPVSAPHEDAEDQGQADRDRREMGGVAGDRGARLLGPHACRRHVCAEPLDVRGGCGSLHHMPSRKADAIGWCGKVRLGLLALGALIPRSVIPRGARRLPARTTVGVTHLARGGIVEVDLIARRSRTVSATGGPEIEARKADLLQWIESDRNALRSWV